MKSIFLKLLLFSSIFSTSQSLTINILEHHFKIDPSNALIVSHIDDIETYNDLSSYSEVILSLNQVDYLFDTVPNSLGYTDSYHVTNASNEFLIYFTQLPIISVESENVIVDEPKVHANFIYSDDEQILISDIGIEIRGGFSQTYPKKTYDLEFWEDPTGEDTDNVQFGNLRSDDDWILDALYNEPLRLRSHVAHKLWLDMHTPQYLDSEPNAKAGADVKYAELFLNGVYNGLYNISEQVDRKQLKLKSYNGDIRGELNKGVTINSNGLAATNFYSLPEYNNNNRIWGGYEMKYPQDDDITDWENMYQFTNFVMNVADDDFTDTIWDKFNYENYLDYFIFLNVLRATDNTGKNLYIAKYKADEPYFYVPWDLDGCFGTIWNGTNQDITNDILTNGFFDRVTELQPNNYATDISTTWFDYRTTILKETNLINTFETQFQYFLDYKIYEREGLVYPNYTFSQEGLTYLLSWLNNRLTYLDTYFSALSVNDDFASAKTVLYPNPTKDKIYISNIDFSKENEYEIYNTFGQLIQKGIISNNFIAIEKLTTGHYIVSIDNESFKFVVM